MAADRLKSDIPPQIVDVRTAHEHETKFIGGSVNLPLSRLSQRVGGEVWVKREDLQAVRSYKLRGAYNLISGLSVEARVGGVVCASAGNHAQGVAFACRALSVPGRVYLPRTTPRQKRQRIAALGGALVEVLIVGDTYDDAAAAAVEDVAGELLALLC